jgi:hypothetical protein
MMFRRSLIDLVFPEDDETFRLHMDFYAVVMAQMVAGLFLIDEALYSYRQHDRNSAADNPVLGGRLHLSSRNWGNTYAEMLDRMLSTLARDHERRPRITSCAHGSPVATRYDERRARNEIVELSDISKRLARLPTPLKVAGWYFPVEVDPSWVDAPRLTDTVQGLPRPLLDQRLRQHQCRTRDSCRLAGRLAARGRECLLPRWRRRPRPRSVSRPALR